MKFWYFSLPILFIITFFNGCARTVTADTYAAPELMPLSFPPDTAFHVTPNADVPNPIFDRNVKTKIETVLRAQNYQVASENGARYTIQYSYNLKGREETRIHELPGHSYYFVGGLGHPHFRNDMYYSTLIAESFPVYIAQLRLRLLQPASGKDQKVIWVGEVWTENLEPDLRNLIDYLIVAAVRFLGKDTQKTEDVRISEKDALLKNLREEKFIPQTSHRSL